MKSNLLSMLIYTMYLSGCILIGVTLSQPVVADDKDTIKEEVTEDKTPTLELQLLQLQKDLNQKEEEKKILERKLRSVKDEVLKEQLTQELVAAEDIIIGMRDEIVNLATGGAKVFTEQTVIKPEFDWKKDMELLFQPLIDQLQELTEHPRLIEKTESEIIYWKKRRQELQQAADNLDKNIASVENKALRKELELLQDPTGSRLNSAEQKLALLQSDLETLKAEKSPIWSTIADIFINIVFEIVLHFFIAVTIALATYQTIKWLSAVIIAIIPDDKKTGHTLLQRSIEIGRIIVGGIITIFTYFIVLYSFAEWLLIVISLIVFASLVLSLRETLPSYLVELKTLFNMGSIRHGERLIHNGLPWEITRLNVHTQLYNRALEGKIRVPLTEIVNLSSRPNQEGELWFPTNTGDIVMMDDNIYGKVIRQTPDIVEINRGHSIYTYMTQDFLSRRPRNLSRNGFTLYEIFGFDYCHQADITTRILNTYRQAIEFAIKTSPFADSSKKVDVQFSMAAPSSLDFRILASFDGKAANEYYTIKRLIQKASVEVSNREGWVIPFQQLTLHYDPVEKNDSRV